jgi:MFS family permease
MMSDSKPPLLNTAMRWFLLTMIFANIAGTMYYTLLPVFLDELGADVKQIGLFFSIAAVVMLILQLVGGWLSDVLGRLRAIALGSIIATAGYIGMVFVPNWGWALVAVCLEYVSGALVAPSFGAFVAEQSSEENRGKVFGVSEGLFMVVGVVGPPIAGLLTRQYGFRVMLTVAAVMYTFTAIMRLWMSKRFTDERTVHPERLNFGAFKTDMRGIIALILGGGLITWILVTDGISDIAFLLSGNLQPLYLEQIGGLDVAQIGWISSLNGLAFMLISFPSGWLVDRFSERVAIAAGFIVVSLGLTLFIVSTNLWMFAAAYVIIGIGFGMLSPAYSSLVSKAVPEHMRGRAYGFFRSSVGLVSLPSPWIGGQLWARFTPQTPFALSAGLAMLAVIPVWLKFKRRFLPQPTLE